ncbi:NAD-dependent epimerase/dehydratase family protein [Halosimplex litoreum]|uniref:NAD-dependent epimerase/dehydratase family protein n=1 Tax=Halosimplex litoreum TaxID=1198301 RepID=A0A7T3FYE5_9EURY|nr:NAD-dependent epimerase/dehydratase family protein [Halosimplex litoreum]QPV62926.1 NAD-dependent epimerase/dehydratase family protein [Halosimplex litoreum]
MELSGKRLVVTGGAGFVGSHLCERLVADNEVVAVDDFSNGERAWLPDGVEVVEGDLTDPEVAAEAITEEVDGVFHFAANKNAAADDIDQYRFNNELTETVLDRMDEVGVDKIAFTSSSTVYGEAPRPTPEDYAPLEPISIYGASKLGEESLLSVYANSHDFTAWVYRFANIVGPRLQLGAVIPDFVDKLEDDPDSLTILGDGRQEKSYMHVDDCVDAMCHVVEHAGDVSEGTSEARRTSSDGDFNVYNLGTRTTTSVTTIADIVSDEMGLDPAYEYTGGDRGWVGDVPRMRLSIEKLSALGWEPEGSSDDAVRRATRQLLDG